MPPTRILTTGLVQLFPCSTQVWNTCVTQNEVSEHADGAEFRTKPRSTGATGLGAGLTE